MQRIHYFPASDYIKINLNGKFYQRIFYYFIVPLFLYYLNKKEKFQRFFLSINPYNALLQDVLYHQTGIDLKEQRPFVIQRPIDINPPLEDKSQLVKMWIDKVLHDNKIFSKMKNLLVKILISEEDKLSSASDNIINFLLDGQRAFLIEWFFTNLFTEEEIFLNLSNNKIFSQIEFKEKPEKILDQLMSDKSFNKILMVNALKIYSQNKIYHNKIDENIKNFTEIINKI